jgi:PAS domain S-box-containing protein
MAEREEQVRDMSMGAAGGLYRNTQRSPEEARFRELVEGLDAIVAEYDVKRCAFTYVSHRAEQLLGYPAENWLTSGFWESILHPEDRDQAIELCQLFISQAVDHEFEYRLVSKEGRAIWLRESARVLRDSHGKAERLFILFMDETSRKRAETLLEAQREILEQVARGEPLETIFRAITRVMATLQPGAPCQISLGEHPDAMRVIASSHTDGDDARMLARAEVRKCWSMPIQTAAGHLRGRLDMHCPDARKPQPEERQLLEAMTHLAALALERAQAQEALRQRAEALAEADRRKDEFLAMLGHELRNPLAPMLTLVKLLPTAEGPRHARMCEVLARQVKHMARLLDDLLDVSRITRGKVQVVPEPLELEDVLHGAVEGVRPFIQQQGHHLVLELGSTSHVLQGDPARLTQVFMNLLHNAAKFTPPGGVITVSVSKDAGRAIVSIRDTGMGIPAELLPHVFEPFRQGEQPLSRHLGGLGIGLTLVRELVSMHGGSVEARSDGPGRGSEFRVSLPVSSVKRRPEARAPQEDSVPLRATRPRRLLVVDDNADAAETLVEFLQFRGHTVHMAHDGLEAIEQARSTRPEAILLDIGLPGMDGFQVAQRLRAEPLTAEATLVALTGYGQEQDRARAQAVGIQHFILKPVNLDELMRLLESL